MTRVTCQQTPPAPRAGTSVADATATTSFRVISWLGGGLGLLALTGCVVLAVYSYYDTTSSTSSIGIAVAIVLALPVLFSLALILAGVLTRRRSPGAGLGLVIAGLIVMLSMLGLVGLQLLLGS